MKTEVSSSSYESNNSDSASLVDKRAKKNKTRKRETKHYKKAKEAEKQARRKAKKTKKAEKAQKKAQKKAKKASDKALKASNKAFKANEIAQKVTADAKRKLLDVSKGVSSSCISPTKPGRHDEIEKASVVEVGGATAQSAKHERGCEGRIREKRLRIARCCPDCGRELEWSNYAGGVYTKGWLCNNIDVCGSAVKVKGWWRWNCRTCINDFCTDCKGQPKPQQRSNGAVKRRQSQSSASQRSSSVSSTPSPSLSSSEDTDPEIHEGVECANCHIVPVRGPRFECAVCKETSLCRRCYKRRDKVHTVGHKFFCMKAIRSGQRCSTEAPSDAGARCEDQSVADDEQEPNKSNNSLITSAPKDETMLAVPTLPLQPSEVCFIRHAQACHNVHKDNILIPDNPLTMDGVNQCKKARYTWAASIFNAADLIVVSPMRRALQTAVWLNDLNTSDQRFLVTSLCTERWSGACDEGTCKSQLIKDYPYLLGWQGIQELEEEWWPRQADNEVDRVNKFLSFLRSRPERKVVVISHGGLLSYIVGYKLTNLGHHTMHTGTLLSIVAAPRRMGKRLAAGSQCSLCLQAARDSVSGVVCRRRREDGGIGGCGKGVCWSCMQQAATRTFGNIRIAKEEWNSLGAAAWWMHEACMTDTDQTDYTNTVVIT